MPSHTFGTHHLHMRKRIYANYEKFPHANKWKNLLDKLMYPAGLLGPFMMIPQIWKIYAEQDASSIALSSWALFLGPAILWAVYGVAHKERVIVISNIGWVTSYIFMIAGAIMY